jgi:hypothetical protein
MMFGVSAAVAAVIAAVTSMVVTALSLLVGDRQQRRREELARRQDLNARYLNPLRLHLVENYYRLADTVRQAERDGGRYEAVMAVAEPAEISGKDASWFNGTGCALASSVYLTGCRARPAPAASQRPVPAPRNHIPSRGHSSRGINGGSRNSPVRSAPGLRSPDGPGILGPSPDAPNPAVAGGARQGRGRAVSTRPELRRRHSRPSTLRVRSHSATSCRNGN